MKWRNITHLQVSILSFLYWLVGARVPQIPLYLFLQLIVFHHCQLVVPQKLPHTQFAIYNPRLLVFCRTLQRAFLESPLIKLLNAYPWNCLILRKLAENSFFSLGFGKGLLIIDPLVWEIVHIFNFFLGLRDCELFCFFDVPLLDDFFVEHFGDRGERLLVRIKVLSFVIWGRFP